MALIIVLRNDMTGPDEAANYEVAVYVNKLLIEHTQVKGHDRKKPWRELVRKLVEK